MKKSIGSKALIYPSPVWCVGTYDKDGKPNVMTASWCGICCSKPPAVTISLRKATYTYKNIMESKAYTISVPSKNQAQEADFFGLTSGKRTDKFTKTGLTPIKADKVHAPYVDEFPMVIECKVIHTFEIGLHTQFIGEVMDVKIDQDILGNDGFPDMIKLSPILYAAETKNYYGVDGYIGCAYSLGKSIK